MSDNLSEDEINALLTPESEKLTPLLEDFVRINRHIKSVFVDTLGTLVGKVCTIDDPQVVLSSPSEVLERLADEIVDVQLNLRGAYSGFHSYYLEKNEALNIANPMLGAENEELDDAALSSIGEAFSQATRAELEFLEREYSERISAGSPDVRLTEKASLALTPPVFTLQYDVSLDGEKSFTLVEIINQDLAESFGKILHQEEVVEEDVIPQKGGDGTKVEGVSFPSFRATEIGPQEEQNLGLLMDVSVTLAVELGRTKWQLRDVLTIGEGSIIELEKQAGEPVDVLVNNNLIARGEVVVVDENFSVRITEIITSFEQMMQKGL